MEQISALVDGELDYKDVARVVSGMNDQEELRDAWSTYHLIGDALRGESCADVKVVQSVAARLAQEPTVLAPHRSYIGFAQRLAIPGIAAAAVLAALAWIDLQTHQEPSNQRITSPVAELALPDIAPPPNALIEPVYVSVQPPSIQYPARNIDAYLQAHQEFSPSKTMQGLVSYARTVSTGTNESGR